MGPVANLILRTPRTIPMPILSFPGAQLVDCSIRDIATDEARQFSAQAALHRKFQTPLVMSAMDLSIEAEEFGGDVQFSDDEIPTVLGRLITDEEGIHALKVPSVGGKRTRVALEVVRRLASLPDGPPVIGGMIGPMSLAGRLFGVSEALLATSIEPDLVTLLLEKATAFLQAYALAFKNAGAQAVLIAEPTAGLLSPGAVSIFSSPWITRIIESVQDDSFEVILHNCGARLVQLKAILGSGAHIFHFGKAMDMVSALEQTPASTILCGNLDPVDVFYRGTPDEVRSKTRRLLETAGTHRNFVISSGCDIPGHAPLSNLEAFFSTVEES